MPEKADDAFIQEYRPLVLSIVKKVRAQFDLRGDVDDLIAYGMEGLVQAKGRFDPERGVKFNTFAYYRIRGAIIDGVRRSTFFSRRAYAKMKAAEAALELGEFVGEQEAAKTEGTTPAAAAEVLHDTLAKMTASFVMASIGQKEEGEGDTPEDSLVREQAKTRLRAALKELPERELRLIEGFYFEGRQFDEVAAEIGISKSWGSRLHYKALARLKSALGDDV
ncbi:MAG: sigma-70 family RNA polymerase sigma factor [Myxococcota bacterium]